MKKHKFAAALTHAKKYLWDGTDRAYVGNQTKWVCNALGMARRDGLITGKVLSDLKDLIEDRLCSHFTITVWLKHNIDIDEYNSASTADFQEYRRRWVDSMIKEFSE